MKEFSKFLIETFKVVPGTPGEESYMEDNVLAVGGMPDINMNVIKAIVSPNDKALTQSFYQTWDKVKKTSSFEATIDKILHYMTTYGTEFTMPAYMPMREIFDIEDDTKVYVVQVKSHDEIIHMCLDLLKTNIALKDSEVETICQIVQLAKFPIVDEIMQIKNRQAKTALMMAYDIVPTVYDEFFRLLILKASGETQIIKTKQMLAKLRNSRANKDTIQSLISAFGHKNIAPHFNRHKAYYLAMKHLAPSNINKIAKLSKKLHQPANQPWLLNVGKVNVREKVHSLAVDQISQVLRALKYLTKEDRNNNLYRIRNGKAWYKSSTVEMVNYSDIIQRSNNINALIGWLRNTLNLAGKTVYIPHGVKYGIPTSGKQFFGNIPFDTEIEIPEGKTMAVGVYWENAGGARDIDISSINKDGEFLGWYGRDLNSHGAYYSGDITNAPDGAIEFIHYTTPYEGYIATNIYSFANFDVTDVHANLVLGFLNANDRKTNKYMMDPAERVFDIPFEMKAHARNNILALVKGNSIRIGQYNMGTSIIAANSREDASIIYYALATKMLNLNDLLFYLGVKFVDKPEDAEIDLSLDAVTKDTFINLVLEQQK